MSKIFAAAVLIAWTVAAAAETRYYWVETNYTMIFVPNCFSWRPKPDQANANTPGAPLTPQALFKIVSPSVYWVRIDPKMVGSAGGVYGSAIAVSEHEAITNCHIVAGREGQLTIGSGDPEETSDAELVALDFDADRCVVKTRKLQLHPVSGIRHYDSLEVGEAVFAIGNPRKMQRTLSSGLISGKRTDNEERLIQFTAAISPGSSGGGLFDANGNLIGVTSYSLTGSQGINFAIPAEDFWK